MSPRVLIASALLALLLAGGAIYFLAAERQGSATRSAGEGDSSRADAGRDRSGAAEAEGETEGGATSGAADPRGSGDGAESAGLPGAPRGGIPRAPGEADAIPGNAGGSDRDGPGALPANGAGGSRAGSSSGSRSGGSGAGETLSPGATVTLRGTVIAVGTDGTRHPEESGRLSVRIVASGHDELRDIAVVTGAWSAPLPQGARIHFLSAILADRPAQVTPDQTVSAAEGVSLELTARWTASTLLHVRSRESGEALCDLELLRIADWMRNSRAHPGAVLPTDARRTAECSPFVLEPESAGSVPYHVRAPGHAWGRILIDTAAGGDRELLLDPGGALDLVFTGGWQAPGALLRLRTGGVAQPYAEVAVLGETMRIEGIHPGAYEVAVETGNWAQEPRVLGHAEVTVRAGELAPLTVALVDLVEEERVPLAGTLFVPEAWLLEEFQLRIRPADPGANATEETQNIPSLEMTASPVSGGILYGWEADPVHAGTHGVLVLPVGFGVNIAVGAEGELAAAIALPEPVMVEVVTLLAGTTLPATPAVIRWTPARAAGVPGAGALSVAPVEGSENVFVFAAPLGDVIISSSDDAYRPTSRQVTASLSGANSFTLELEPAHGVHVLLFDGETPVPWDIGWHAHLTPAEGSTGQVVTRGRIGLEYRVLVSNPGPYILTVPDIDGFLAVPPQPVEVLEGQIIDIAIDLVREP